MHPVYHAKITVSTKNFPRSEGRKCGVKGLDQWHGLTTGKGRERVRVSQECPLPPLEGRALHTNEWASVVCGKVQLVQSIFLPFPLSVYPWREDQREDPNMTLPQWPDEHGNYHG